jgi:hypothetical protein
MKRVLPPANHDTPESPRHFQMPLTLTVLRNRASGRPPLWIKRTYLCLSIPGYIWALAAFAGAERFGMFCCFVAAAFVIGLSVAVSITNGEIPERCSGGGTRFRKNPGAFLSRVIGNTILWCAFNCILVLLVFQARR